jgi:GT2 family glycosyltransferase
MTGETVPGNRWDLLDGRRPDPPPSVSVIVVHYEQPVQLARTLRALTEQTHPAARREVIVVDDGSADPPAVPADTTLLRQADAGARPGAARNLGAAHARGDVLCFLDADTAPEPEYLEALTRLPALAPEAVTVGRRRHADFAALEPRARPADGRRAELPEPRWLRDGLRASRDLLDADERSYRFVISAVLACSRRFFTEVGGFADFDTYGGEDWEWAHRAWRAGAILAHVPAAVAWHDGPEWSGRDDPIRRRAVKNAETRRLADLIGVAGSRGRALRPLRAETVMRVAPGGGPAARFVCLDSLLAVFPDAAIVLPPGDPGFPGDDRVRPAEAWPAERLAWPRLQIEVHRPLIVAGDELVRLAETAVADDRGWVTVVDDRGPLLTLGATRARRRAERWGETAETLGERCRSAGVSALEDEPDLEAWVGGWGAPV